MDRYRGDVEKSEEEREYFFDPPQRIFNPQGIAIAHLSPIDSDDRLVTVPQYRLKTFENLFLFFFSFSFILFIFALHIVVCFVESGKCVTFFFFFLMDIVSFKEDFFFFRSRDYLLRSIMIILWHGCCEIIARVTRF